MSFIAEFLFGGKKAGQQAAASAKHASNVASRFQEKALDYLKESDELPRQIREQSLTGLSEYYKVPGEQKTQQELIDEAKSSPLYASILGSRKSGEDAILRNASATGGLRSGNSNAALTDYNMQLENTALLEAFNQTQSRQDYERGLNLSGLADLANLPSGGANIANLTAGIGDTKAAGITAAAQARQAGQQNNMGNLLGLGTAIAGAFCDIRLKRNIQFIGRKQGYRWYKWEWCAEARDKLNLPATGEGVMAHQVYELKPEAVGLIGNFLAVDYDKLGIRRAA